MINLGCISNYNKAMNLGIYIYLIGMWVGVGLRPQQHSNSQHTWEPELPLNKLHENLHFHNE